MLRAAVTAVSLALCTIVVAGLQQQPVDTNFRLATPEQAIAVASEQQLRAALAADGLGWSDRRVVQLTADIQLSATLVISSPVRLQGNCGGSSGSATAGSGQRCGLRGAAARPTPLLHITGPAAVVELSNLELTGGVGSGSLAGAITASNHSMVELVAVRLSGNSAASGGAVRVDSHARLGMTACELTSNSAQQSGGAIFAHSGTVHLDRSTVRDNSAAEGAGVCLCGGSRLTAADCQLDGNRHASGSSDSDSQGSAVVVAAGADLLLLDGENSAAYLDPLPVEGQLAVSGGKVRRLALLKEDPEAAVAADASQLHQLWQADKQQQRKHQQPAKEQQVVKQQQGQRQGAGQHLHQHPQKQQQLAAPNKQLSADEQIVVDWMDAVAHQGGSMAGGSHRAVAAAAAGEAQQQLQQQLPRRSRKLKQQGAAGVVSVTNEQELAEAIGDKERFISIESHIGLTGAYADTQSALPPVKASITLTGNCDDGIYGGRCLIDAKALGRIIHVDNSGYFPSVFVKFENIRFTNGQAQGLGGAFFNQGKIQAEFVNCEFVANSALNGAGAVALQDGAIGLFNKVLFKQNSAAYGAGGALYITSNAGFTEVAFQSNTGPSGGAVAVGQSSTGIYFNGCTFNGNVADVFGNDVYMESWVQTAAFFNPFPTAAAVYPETSVQPYTAFVSWPSYVLLVSPPPSPPRPPRPPPPAPPSPPNPASWVYNEDQLWQAMSAGNATITLGAHIQMAPGGRWWQGPPPTIVFPLTVVSQCKGFGAKCIIDLNGAPNPLFLITTNALFSASNVRILNGATMGSGGAVQITGAVRSVQFDWCDFMGNVATDGGAVNVLGSSNILFTNCNMGLNFADNMGGAVKTVGANVTFSNTAFYQNRAVTGGALGMGPMSNIVLLSSNFSDNLASKTTKPDGRWGDDIFIASPVGSVLYLNKLPPESVAKIFPRLANTQSYSGPPPGPAPPPFLGAPFVRPPYPPPAAQPPARVRSSPPSPPTPPPAPPPSPPAPPLGPYIKKMPVMWAPVIMGAFGILVMAFLLTMLCCHKRVLPRLEKPGELAKRLRGEYTPSDSDDEDLTVANLTQSEIEVVQEAWPFGTARFRRKPAHTPSAAAAAQDRTPFQ